MWRGAFGGGSSGGVDGEWEVEGYTDQDTAQVFYDTNGKPIFAPPKGMEDGYCRIKINSRQFVFSAYNLSSMALSRSQPKIK